jgi:hypothetical protein
MKCHILAHFRPISEYFDLLRLLEKCGEAPHPAKTLGLFEYVAKYRYGKCEFSVLTVLTVTLLRRIFKIIINKYGL